MAEKISQVPNVLTIAGSDSGGGAGIQADLKTFSALNTYGLSAVTAVTAQNTQGVHAVELLTTDIVEKQMAAVFDDIDIAAVKIGMLGNAELISAVVKQLKNYQPNWVVVDPVMVATSGDRLIENSAMTVLQNDLFPLASLITPNLLEAEALLGGIKINTESDMVVAAKQLSQLCRCAVLLKGGHSVNHLNESNDLLVLDGQEHWFKGARVMTQNTHGTGCTLSSAVAANLALGKPLVDSVGLAKAYIQHAIAQSGKLNVGKGRGPVNHFSLTATI